MRSFAEQLVKSRRFKTFTEQVIVDDLGEIEHVQNRDRHRGVEGRGSRTNHSSPVTPFKAGGLLVKMADQAAIVLEGRTLNAPGAA